MSSSFINANQVPKTQKSETEDSKKAKHNEYADLAKDCYNPGSTNDVNGWKVVKVFNDKKTGFCAKLYEKNGEFVFATAGITLTSGKDWYKNIAQHFGLEADLFEQSIAMVQELVEEFSNLTFVGHSLGGGLASANARATGCPAVLFNPSALNDRYNLGLPANITTFISNGDILDYVNKMAGATPLCSLCLILLKDLYDLELPDNVTTPISNVDIFAFVNKMVGAKVQGMNKLVEVASSKLPNMQDILVSGIYQLLRGVLCHIGISTVS